MKKTSLTMILSTGRTGTKFLAKLFNHLYMNNAITVHEGAFSRSINILTNLQFARLVPKQWVSIAWRLLRRPKLVGAKTAIYIDINNFMYGIVSIDPYIYSDIRIIHIVRDPREYVRSHINWADNRPISFIANYLIPFWQPSPLFSIASKKVRNLGLSKFTRFCWIWNFKNGVINSVQDSDTPYFLLRFEDLFNPETSKKSFRAVTDFIGLEKSSNLGGHFAKPANQTLKQSFPHWRDWDAKQCAQLDQLCGGLMAEYGYGIEPEWKKNVEIGRRAL